VVVPVILQNALELVQIVGFTSAICRTPPTLLSILSPRPPRLDFSYLALALLFILPPIYLLLALTRDAASMW
jgi:hypothetical protein